MSSMTTKDGAIYETRKVLHKFIDAHGRVYLHMRHKPAWELSDQFNSYHGSAEADRLKAVDDRAVAERMGNFPAPSVAF